MIPSYSRRSFVESQLRRLTPSHGVSFNGGNVVMRCPFHSGGNERTPSLYVDLTGKHYKEGAWHCFAQACEKNQKGRGTWNSLARKLNLDIIGRPDEEDVHIPTFEDAVRTLTNDEGMTIFDYSDLPSLNLWPIYKSWRGISGKLVNKIKGREIIKYGQPHLIFPVTVNGICLSSITCSLEKTKVSYKYDTNKDIRYALFPYDYVKSLNEDYIVIVEGTRDALHLLDNGIAALAVLGGISTWNEHKRDLVLSLNPKFIIAAPDPDEVGNALSDKIREEYTALRIPVKRFKMSSEVVWKNNKRKIVKLEDPGDLSPSRIGYLKNKIEEFSKQYS